MQEELHSQMDWLIEHHPVVAQALLILVRSMVANFEEEKTASLEPFEVRHIERRNTDFRPTFSDAVSSIAY